MDEPVLSRDVHPMGPAEGRDLVVSQTHVYPSDGSRGQVVLIPVLVIYKAFGPPDPQEVIREWPTMQSLVAIDFERTLLLPRCYVGDETEVSRRLCQESFG